MNEHRYVTPKPGPYQSQHGEDAWLERYFRGKQRGFFVEVGAYDGLVISNTYYFEQLGWRGVLVEPNPSKADACRRNRPNSRVYQCAAVASSAVTSVELLDVPDGEVYSTVVPSDFNLGRLREYGLASRAITVPARTLDSILEEDAPFAVDFVSIDVEGAELDVLSGFDLTRWKPRLVLVESPTPRIPGVRDYFVERGYAYLRSIDVNDIYERLPDLLPLDDVPLLARAIDAARYRVRKTLATLRQKTRIRTRLRTLGLFR